MKYTLRNIENLLNCGKCNFIINASINIYETKCCGTLFCEDCINRDDLNKTCEKCKKPMVYGMNSFAKRILRDINVTCKYCFNKYPNKLMKKHMTICDKRIFKCYFCKEDKKNENFINETKFRVRDAYYKEDYMKHLLNEHQDKIIELNDNFEKIQNLMKGNSISHIIRDRNYIKNINYDMNYQSYVNNMFGNFQVNLEETVVNNFQENE